MYEAIFHLDSRPFPSTPRVDRYFPASTIEEALRTVSRCVDRSEGPGLVIGGPGTGKSLLCEMLATRFRERFHVVRLDSGRLCTRRALLQNILFELHLPYRETDEGCLRLALIDFLEPGEASREGMLLLVDEAHTLPLRLIEEIRMITNLVRDGQPRARLVLAGDTMLEEHLGDPNLESLNQRIAARCYLRALNYEETIDFISSQIAAVGGSSSQLFADDALQAVYHATDGIPRLINQVCDHALLLLADKHRTRLDKGVIEEAWADLQQLPMPASSETPAPAAGSGVVEFGSLDEEPVCADPFDSLNDRLLGEEVDEDTDIIEDDVNCVDFGSAEEMEDTRAIEQTREIDLTEQLTVIEEHFQQIESYDATLVCEDAMLDAVPIDAEPPHSEQASGEKVEAEQCETVERRTTDPSDPFAEPFAHEECVADHYTTLETSRDSRGNAGSRGTNRDYTSTLKTIFTPPDTPQDTAGAESPAVESASPNEDANGEETAKLGEAGSEGDAADSQRAKSEQATAPIDTDVTNEPDADNASKGVGVVRARVLRSLPPDDSDLLLVVDEPLECESLEELPKRTHRRRYRDLFTRLRDS
jgi:type II secretory pathway predicted ATPase ExeA